MSNQATEPNGAAGTRLALPDAELWWYPQALSTPEADRAFVELRDGIDWREEDIVLFGRRYRQPRLMAWHGDEGAVYRYSGRSFQPAAWTPALSGLRARVEAIAGRRFNSVLLNRYRNQRDAMGWHSDDEAELGPEPVIASLSLGEVREFQLRHRLRRDLPIARLTLTPGSLLMMAGPTQQCWKHRVRRESRNCGERINLTFRSIVATRR
jgi:alkylated DNA repair dioxygenase AlkB